MNEIISDVDGRIYFKTNASTAAEAREQMIKALEAAGFDLSNVTFSNVELRDSDGSTFDRIEE